MREDWKVFIRGNKDRGEEVIKALEDCGASNSLGHIGDYDAALYFINHNGIIDSTRDYNAEFAKIIMDNYTELHLPEKWKDGDILVHTDDDGSTDYAVYKETEEFNEYTQPYSILTYASVNKHVYGINIIVFKDNWKLASDEEHKEFYDLLHKHGVDWDSGNKQLIKWKWKPKMNETYWFITGCNTIIRSLWANTSLDNKYFEIGNCFQSRKEAVTAAERVKKALKGI